MYWMRPAAAVAQEMGKFTLKKLDWFSGTRASDHRTDLMFADQLFIDCLQKRLLVAAALVFAPQALVDSLQLF